VFKARLRRRRATSSSRRTGTGHRTKSTASTTRQARVLRHTAFSRGRGLHGPVRNQRRPAVAAKWQETAFPTTRQASNKARFSSRLRSAPRRTLARRRSSSTTRMPTLGSTTASPLRASGAGMDVADSVYKQYGEAPNQGLIQAQATRTWTRSFQSSTPSSTRDREVTAVRLPGSRGPVNVGSRTIRSARCYTRPSPESRRTPIAARPSRSSPATKPVPNMSTRTLITEDARLAASTSTSGARALSAITFAAVPKALRRASCADRRNKHRHAPRKEAVCDADRRRPFPGR